jgi:hypothetical protein
LGLPLGFIAHRLFAAQNEEIMNSTTAESPMALGQVVITAKAREALNSQEVLSALWRHAHEPWGKCFNPDDEKNDTAVKEDRRLVSNHLSLQGQPFRIATKTEDRITTIFISGERDFSSVGLVDAWLSNLACPSCG